MPSDTDNLFSPLSQAQQYDAWGESVNKLKAAGGTLKRKAIRGLQVVEDAGVKAASRDHLELGPLGALSDAVMGPAGLVAYGGLRALGAKTLREEQNDKEREERSRLQYEAMKRQAFGLDAVAKDAVIRGSKKKKKPTGIEYDD